MVSARSWRSRASRAVRLIGAALVLSACVKAGDAVREAGAPPAGEPRIIPREAASPHQPPAGLEAEHQRLKGEHDRLEQQYRILATRYRELEERQAKQTAAGETADEKLAQLQLQLLEKEFQLRLLNEKLEAAMLEVVRAMAKLRGMENKAEAASNLAEAEVALRRLGERGSRVEGASDLPRAEQLLRLAADEFQKQNYGGTLYLAGQAKALIKGAPGAPVTASGPMLDGEVAFAVPLPLKTLAKSNVRDGPGANFRVVYIVESGTRVTGQSYRGAWVRVTGSDGRSGWIFYNLIGRP